MMMSILLDRGGDFDMLNIEIIYKKMIKISIIGS